MSKIFLQAEWRKLMMANYAVDAALLQAYVPYKTELDIYDGICYVSLVGFMFNNTKMLGLKIPAHVNFEEVNLRFYVRHQHEGEWRRGVVFIKELVPKLAISLVANTLYGEHYETCAMRHNWTTNTEDQVIEYAWKKGTWQSMQVRTGLAKQPIPEGSEAEFITEHYWGYTQLGAQKTSQYGVEHPRWEVYPVLDYKINIDFGQVYGQNFAFLNGIAPKSVFLAEGSEIIVRAGEKIGG